MMLMSVPRVQLQQGKEAKGYDKQSESEADIDIFQGKVKGLGSCPLAMSIQ